MEKLWGKLPKVAGIVFSNNQRYINTRVIIQDLFITFSQSNSLFQEEPAALLAS